MGNAALLIALCYTYQAGNLKNPSVFIQRGKACEGALPYNLFLDKILPW